LRPRFLSENFVEISIIDFRSISMIAICPSRADLDVSMLPHRARFRDGLV